MSTHPSFTVTGSRVFDGRSVLGATCVRVVGGRIDAVGDAAIAGPDDTLVDGRGGTLLPGLVDAHVHLLPGCTQLAAGFGVTTLIDQFSKPEVIEPESEAVAAAAQGSQPERADLRTSGIGATAPGGHPTMAYAPLPYVTAAADAKPFVSARLAEGATHFKVILDNGAGPGLDIPALDTATIEELVQRAHEHGLPVVVHASTAADAVKAARCGADVLAHAPFEDMSEAQIGAVADARCALIGTLAVTDGFPGDNGLLPLLNEPGLAARIPARWRKVLRDQSRRWMPPEPPDGAAARRNALALHQAGTAVLAGTDAPNPGLVFGASLHREMGHLVAAGLTPAEALTAATAAPAETFGLADRGRIAVGRRADLVLVDGDPTARIEAARDLRTVWIAGRRTEPDAYPGSPAEREGVRWLRATNQKIMAAIEERWPGFPAPEVIRREDGEQLGQVVPTAGGWQAATVFGALIGAPVADREAAEESLRTVGLSCLAEPWWAREAGGPRWHRAHLVEVRPDRVRLRWADPEADQPALGRWFDIDDIDLSFGEPEETAEAAG